MAVACVMAATAMTACSGRPAGDAVGGQQSSPTPTSGAAGLPSAATAAPTTQVPVPSPSVPAPTATGSPTTVPARTVETTEAPLDERKDLGNGVAVQVTDVEPVKGEARGPGEVAGDALRIRLKVLNRTKRPVSMEMAVVNLYYGPDAAPASGLSGPGAVPLPSSIPPGSSGTGRYVYNVPQDGRDTIKVEFSYTTAAPTVVFTGKPGVR